MTDSPEKAKARVDRLNRALRGDPEALAELDRKAASGIDPIDLAHDQPAEEVAASRSSAAKKAWATRRAAGWVHPRSRSS